MKDSNEKLIAFLVAINLFSSSRVSSAFNAFDKNQSECLFFHAFCRGQMNFNENLRTTNEHDY